MIRIRKSNGDSVELPSGSHFVEIVNDMDGSVGLVFMQPEPGVVVQVVPGTVDADRYAGMFAKHGVKMAKLEIVTRR